jgi:hypothetical protein
MGATLVILPPFVVSFATFARSPDEGKFPGKGWRNGLGPVRDTIDAARSAQLRAGRRAFIFRGGKRLFPHSNRGCAAQENLKAWRSTARLRDVRHGIWRVGRGAVMGVIFLIGHQWLLGAAAKEKCEHRNEHYEKNLHTPFLPMHRNGNGSKW